MQMNLAARSKLTVSLSAADHGFRKMWDRSLALAVYPHLRQTYEWALLQSRYGWEAEFLAIEREGELLAGALALLKALPGGWIRIGTTPCGPFWRPGEEQALKDLFDLLTEFCRRRRVVLCRVQIPCPAEDFDRFALYLPRCSYPLPHVWTYWNTPRPIMEIDIRGTFEQILERMHHKTRYRYRTATRRGVTVQPGGQAALEDFARLMRETARRKGIPVRDRSYFETLLRVFPEDRASLLIATGEGRTLGGQIVVCSAGRAYALYAAVAHHPSLYPSEALDAATILWAKERNCLTLDLGGTCTNWPPSPENKGYGVYDYKRRLGAVARLLAPYVDVVARPGLYRMARACEEILLPIALESGRGGESHSPAARPIRGAVPDGKGGLSVALLARVARRIRRDGFIATLRFAIGTLRREVLGLYRLERLVEPACTSGARIEAGIEFLRRVRQGRDSLPDEFYHDHRQGGAQCFCATLSGQPAGVVWIRTGVNSSRCIRLGPQQAEISGLYVLPWARGKGIAKELYWRACVECLENNIREIFAVIAENNLPSKKAAEAVGFRRVAVMRRAALWGPRFTPNAEQAPVPTIREHT